MKKDFSADALDAFELERPIAKPPLPPALPMAETKEPLTPEVASPPLSSTALISINNQPGSLPPDSSTMMGSELPAEPEKQELIRRTYYISPSQHRALKLRAATSDKSEEKDTSAIVRTAIDWYLSKE